MDGWAVTVDISQVVEARGYEPLEAVHQHGREIPGFRHPPAEPHIRLNVRFGSEAEVQQTRAGCLLLAISGHKNVCLKSEIFRNWWNGNPP